MITGCITLLAIDLVPHKQNDLKFDFARVSAQSFAVRGKTQKNIYKTKAEKLTGGPCTPLLTGDANQAIMVMHFYAFLYTLRKYSNG